MIDRYEAHKLTTEILVAAINSGSILKQAPNINITIEAANDLNIDLICKAYTEIFKTVQKTDD